MRHPALPARRIAAAGPSAALLLAAALLAPPAAASPREYLPVGDPLESELRVLDLLGSQGLGGRLLLPHLGTRPLRRLEIEGRGPGPESLDVARAISVARLERGLGRDAAAWFAPDPRWRGTPRLFAAGAPDEERFELSTALEGRAVADTGDAVTFASESGAHARVSVEAGRWLFFSDLLVGRVERARSFADPLVARTDVIAYTADTYLAWASADGRLGARLGRSRWHWGPGEEASLVLSKTSAPLTGLSYEVHLPALRLEATALSATLRESAGEQLAAHRLEWQPVERLRLGLTEAARYRASAWQPLYAAGLVPYILVQRLLAQDEPDSAAALRNNVLLACDLAWRIADGTRVYGELLVDDLHAATSANPDKIGWQVGWEGVGTIGASRLTWGGEFTRLTRYVYTSFFGRDFSDQGEPLGFPTGPDARRIALRGACDLGPDWQLLARVARTDKGENGLDEPFVPGSPPVSTSTFEGVVERTREGEAGLRWWPAGGVDLSARAGYRWVENAGHVAGRHADHVRVVVEARLAR